MTPRERYIGLIKSVADRHGVCLNDILGMRKHSHVVDARRECMAILRGEGLSCPQIGRLLNRDSSTIVHNLQKYLWSKGHDKRDIAIPWACFMHPEAGATAGLI